jgi:YbbR domain-containing protein
MDRWLSRPNVVKVLALVLAILLWVVVHLEEGTSTGANPISLREEKIYNVNIAPQYDQNLYYIRSIEPAEVMVSLKGKDSALKRIVSGSYKVELDLTSVGKGEFVLPLKPVGFPPTVSVSILPETVKVVLEEQQKKEMPAIINLVGTPAEGLKAGQPIVNPNRVHVTMPSSQLSEVDSVRAEVNIDKATSAVSKQVKLIAYDVDGKEVNAQISPQVVSIEVPITSPFKTMPLQLKIVNQPPAGYSVATLEQKDQQVTVYGPQTQLDKMDFYAGPQLDLSGMTESKELSLPIGVQPNITKVNPAEAGVKITIVPSATKNLHGVPVAIIGQNDAFNTSITVPGDGQIDLQLEGATTLLDKLAMADVQAFVDVSNLPPGVHAVKVNLNLPAYIKNVTPSMQASVEIQAKQQP